MSMYYSVNVLRISSPGGSISSNLEKVLQKLENLKSSKTIAISYIKGKEHKKVCIYFSRKFAYQMNMALDI